MAKYTPKIAAEICRRLASGEGLRGICRDSGMPSEALVRSWAIDNVDGFSARYARAREIQADVLAEDTVEIADTEEDPQKARVRIDARKWFASKVAPKKYGDRIQQDVTLDLGDALTARLDAAKARLNGA
jgi:hypothetical protein